MKQETQGHLQRAEELLDAAALLFLHDHAADSISRSYYAMFHAATAALLEHGLERSSHGAAFSQFLVKPGLLDRRLHAYLRKAFDARSESDYWPSPAATLRRAERTLENSREFVAACRALAEETSGG